VKVVEHRVFLVIKHFIRCNAKLSSDHRA